MVCFSLEDADYSLVVLSAFKPCISYTDSNAAQTLVFCKLKVDTYMLAFLSTSRT